MIRILSTLQSKLIPIQEPNMPASTKTNKWQKEADALRQRLTDCVPDMLHGFTITTLHGVIEIEPGYAEAFRNLTADVLQYKLNILENEMIK